MVREAGASEVHVRISSPPTISPCYYGIDTPTHAELIASSDSKLRPRNSAGPNISGVSGAPANSSAAYSQTIQEICQFLEADSLGYLSLENLRAAVGDSQTRFCTSCFTGNYPTPPVQLEVNGDALRRGDATSESIPPVTVTRES
jgi:amidophosphoribosyltransferase